MFTDLSLESAQKLQLCLEDRKNKSKDTDCEKWISRKHLEIQSNLYTWLTSTA